MNSFKSDNNLLSGSFRWFKEFSINSYIADPSIYAVALKSLSRLKRELTKIKSKALALCISSQV